MILVLALVVLGPEKLPGAMRKAGRYYAEFRKMSSSFQEEFRRAIDEPTSQIRSTADIIRESVDLRQFDATGTLTSETSATTEVGETVTSATTGIGDATPTPEGETGTASNAEVGAGDTETMDRALMNADAVSPVELSDERSDAETGNASSNGDHGDHGDDGEDDTDRQAASQLARDLKYLAAADALVHVAAESGDESPDDPSPQRPTDHHEPTSPTPDDAAPASHRSTGDGGHPSEGRS